MSEASVPFNAAWKGLRIQSTVLPPAKSVRTRTATRDTTRADATPAWSSFSTPPPDTVNSGSGNYFEALRDSKDRTEIPYASVHLRPQIMRLMNGLNRKLLAAVGRYLVDNNGMVSYAVETIANYSTPVHPYSACSDEKAAKAYSDFFKNWANICDFTRRFTLDEMQRIACIAIDSDGDIGAALEIKNDFPFLRFFDTFHIGTLTGLDPKDGVDSDAFGTVLGYNICDGDIASLTSTTNRYFSANQLFLLRDATRWDHYRGYSPIRRGSNDIRDNQDIKSFLKLQEKIRAAFGGVIQTNGGPLEEDEWGNDNGPDGVTTKQNANPSTTPQEKKIGLWEMLGGDFPTIEGQLKMLDTKLPGTGGIEFLEFLAGQFVAGLSIPPAYYLDEKLTGPNVRSVLGKAQKKFNNRIAVMSRFVEWLWRRIIAWGIATGQLPSTPDWWRISFQLPAISTIDLGDQLSNERADVLCGLMSEKERYGNRGRNSEHEEKQIVSEIRSKIRSAVEIQQEFAEAEIPIEIILTRMGFGNLAIRATLDNQEQSQDGGHKNEQKKKKDQKK